jgi:hypothetical protein
MSERQARAPFLAVMAVLFGLLTISNLTKALQYARNPSVGGIVIFGTRFEGVGPNLVFGPLMALVTGAYAYGLWRRRWWVGPLSAAYAFYVPTNLVLFWYFHTSPDIPPLGFMLAYLAVALTGSIGTAFYLARHGEMLRSS